MFRILFSALLLCSFLCIRCRVFSSEKVKGIENLILVQKKVPLFESQANHEVAEINFDVPENSNSQKLRLVKLFFKPLSSLGNIESVFIHRSECDGNNDALFGTSNLISNETIVKGSHKLKPGKQTLFLGFVIKAGALLHQSIQIEKIVLVMESGEEFGVEPDKNYTYRPAKKLRAAGQDDCDTYRIPGLITTNNGTLIAVYDNRYNNSKDLQEDIDVGMSRSTDGGQTWEPMRVIMDMGEWGEQPQRLNGIGDPCVLFDHTTATIWVAGLWKSGGSPDDMLWWSSKPGMEPHETGQFILTKSTDDGITWSEPVNITRQIKDPGWQLLLQGPGKGITLDDGTLVFPAQFKADIGKKAIDGGQYTSHSTIVYSNDGGETWNIGTGAKPNTTEAQVVQLPDGSLMLNMRDDRNRVVKDDTNGRAVAVTADMGETWSAHPSSNSALPEPNCMGSLISANISINGNVQKVLFFSNPNNRETRTNMTLKASLDNGNTWPEKYWTELNELPGFGYSCLTMVNENTVGILYEGTKSLFFQKVPVNEIFTDLSVKMNP